MSDRLRGVNSHWERHEPICSGGFLGNTFNYYVMFVSAVGCLCQQLREDFPPGTLLQGFHFRVPIVDQSEGRSLPLWCLSNSFLMFDSHLPAVVLCVLDHHGTLAGVSAHRCACVQQTLSLCLSAPL